MSWTQHRHPQEVFPCHFPPHPLPSDPHRPCFYPRLDPGAWGSSVMQPSLIYNSVLRYHPRVEITYVDNGSTACSSRGKGHHLDAVALFPSPSNDILTSRAHLILQVKTQQECSIMKKPVHFDNAVHCCVPPISAGLYFLYGLMWVCQLLILVHTSKTDNLSIYFLSETPFGKNDNKYAVKSKVGKH